jgi:hypothetical protein
MLLNAPVVASIKMTSRQGIGMWENHRTTMVIGSDVELWRAQGG